MRTTAVSLDIREASVFYGAHRVLDRVSLSAAGGEFFALLGASGCGKTTLLRAISGFVGLASGSIIVGGHDVTRLSPEKRNIAMVFPILRPMAAYDSCAKHRLRPQASPCQARRDRCAHR
jgi:ABC-type Fe3+/spermidine/putrescine transport system ATPase subunit